MFLTVTDHYFNYHKSWLVILSRIRSNFFYNTLLSVSKLLFPLITFPYATRILGPQGLGVVNFVDNYTQYFVILLALGIPVYGIRETAKVSHDKELLGNLVSDLLLINLLNTLGGLFLYLLIPFLTNKLFNYPSFYILGSFYLLINIFTVEWYFQGMSDFKYITIRTLIIRMLAVVVLFFLVRKQEDAIYYYGLTLLTLLANAILNFTRLMKQLHLSFSFGRLKQHLKPLLYLFFANVAISLYILLDSVILGYMTNEKEVGYYTAALRLVKIFLSIIGSLAIIMIPQISSLFKDGEHARIKELLAKSFYFIISVAVPIVIGLILLSKEVILIIAGPAYVSSISTIQILAPIVVFIGLSNLFGMQILTPTNNEKYLLLAVAIGSAVSIVLNFVMSRIFLHNGTAIATLLAEGAVMMLSGYFATRRYSVKWDYFYAIKTILFCIPFWPIYYLTEMITTNLYVIVSLTAGLCAVYYFLIQVFVLKNELWCRGFIFLQKKIK